MVTAKWYQTPAVNNEFVSVHALLIQHVGPVVPGAVPPLSAQSMLPEPAILETLPKWNIQIGDAPVDDTTGVVGLTQNAKLTAPANV